MLEEVPLCRWKKAWCYDGVEPGTFLYFVRPRAYPFIEPIPLVLRRCKITGFHCSTVSMFHCTTVPLFQLFHCSTIQKQTLYWQQNISTNTVWIWWRNWSIYYYFVCLTHTVYFVSRYPKENIWIIIFHLYILFYFPPSVHSGALRLYFPGISEHDEKKATDICGELPQNLTILILDKVLNLKASGFGYQRHDDDYRDGTKFLIDYKAVLGDISTVTGNARFISG